MNLPSFARNKKTTLSMQQSVIFLHLVIFLCTIFTLYKCNSCARVSFLIKLQALIYRQDFFVKKRYKWYLTECDFSCISPLPTSSNNILYKKGKETLINIEKSTKLSTKHCNSKIFSGLRNVLQNILFFFTNLSQGNFVYCRGFLY